MNIDVMDRKVRDCDVNVQNVNRGCQDINKNMHEAEEGEDEVETLNTITSELDKLNIESDDEFTERGPTSGVPVNLAVPTYAQKPLPIDPVTFFGTQQYHGIIEQSQLAGNRRPLDDPDDPAAKFIKPLASSENVMTSKYQWFPNIQSFRDNMNDLSQELIQPRMNTLPLFKECPPEEFRFADSTDNRYCMTRTIKNQNSLTGEDVTIHSPLSGDASNITDEFLESLEKAQPHYYAEQTYPSYIQNDFRNGTNMPGPPPNHVSSNMGGQFMSTTYGFNCSRFKAMHHHSDPSESGIESEEGSPCSYYAPSPSSTYTNPNSVDSVSGQSRIHESKVMHGISSPKYHAESPSGYRTTPSPTSSSGYGSPGHPILDGEDFFNDAEHLADLKIAYDIINADIQQDNLKKNQHKSLSNAHDILPPSDAVMPPTSQCLMPNLPMMPQIESRPSNIGLPLQTMPSYGTTIPPTVTTTPQIIIIPFQDHISAPVILVPVQTKPSPPNRYKKILPKVAQSTATSGPIGTGVTTFSGSQLNHPRFTLPTKSADMPINKNAMMARSYQVQAQQQKQLLIARRAVANISREDLKKSDDEGDTYLHIAVCKTDRYMVQALLERLHRENLDTLVDQENNRRQTPLYLAVLINQHVMVSMFVQFQANVNVLAQNLSNDRKTTEVKAAIHVAASQGYDYHRTLTELLKAKDVNINIVNNNGQTALHCAVLAHNKAKMNNSSERICSIEIIETLIKAGAEPSAQDKKNGKTPLMYAIEKGDLTLIETILKTVEPSKVKNVVKTQAFDGSSCLKIAEGLKDNFERMEIWNKLWNSLQSAINGSMAREVQYQTPVF